MKDVAREAGVSSTTVSHVINGTRTVSPATLERVRLAMAAVGYEPDAVARSLRRRQTMMLGVLVTDTRNAFYSEIVRGIEDVAHLHGYSVIQGSSDEERERQEQYLRIFSAQRVDGLILVPTGPQSPVLDSLVSRKVPMVFVDRRPVDSTAPFVGTNNIAASEEAVEHLLSRGHRRIGLIAGLPGLSTTDERIDGYKAAIERAGLAFDDGLVQHGDSRVEGGYRAAHDLMQNAEPPTAIFVANNRMTLGALRLLREEGVRVPDDVSVVGFDAPEWAALVEPPLTVVKQPTRAMGKRAAERLIAGLKTGTLSRDDVILSAELVVGQSCADR